MIRDWFNLTNTCKESFRFFTNARSPIFIDGENPNWKLVDYSSWTESMWLTPSARIFLKPSFAHELATLLTGIAVLLASHVTIYFMGKHSSTIFTNKSIIPVEATVITGS